MQLRKLIVFLLSLVWLVVAYAGNYEDFDVEDVRFIPPLPVYTGVYGEIRVGYASRDWEQNIPFQGYISNVQGGGAPPYGKFRRGKGGSTAGFDLGYQWNEYFSVETGWSYFTEIQYTIPRGVTAPEGGNLKMRSWYAYLALKFSFPVYKGLTVFSKFGTANVNVKSRFLDGLTPALGGPDRGDYWTPAFAVGVQYYFNWNMSINIQYLHLNGYNREPLDGILRKVPSPHSDIFSLGIGCKIPI